MDVSGASPEYLTSLSLRESLHTHPSRNCQVIRKKAFVCPCDYEKISLWKMRGLNMNHSKTHEAHVGTVCQSNMWPSGFTTCKDRDLHCSSSGLGGPEPCQIIFSEADKYGMI